MEFRDLKTQYKVLKPQIDQAVCSVLEASNYICGCQVAELESQLASYAGVKHCITCANGTDALTLALKALNIGPGDGVFIPDFTFFASAETAALEGAEPVFADVEEETFNLSPDSLEKAVKAVLEEGRLKPRAVIAVDLFGQPADYKPIREICDRYGLFLIEDGAQGFGGRISLNGSQNRACSFGDISTTSFFPAKPLGCYGDGGAVFTDNDEWAAFIRSLAIHGKGTDKYDNVRIGMNSRLDTIQAAILLVKLKAFMDYELEAVNKAAAFYTDRLIELSDKLKTPGVKEGFYSSWAQYSILLNNKEERDKLQAHLKEKGIPSMVYYPKPMSSQTAFAGLSCKRVDLRVSAALCQRVLALPVHPYITIEDQEKVVNSIKDYKNLSACFTGNI